MSFHYGTAIFNSTLCLLCTLLSCICIGIKKYVFTYMARRSDPGEGMIGVSRNRLKLTRQFSGQTQTVNIRGLTIIVSLMKVFKYIFF